MSKSTRVSELLAITSHLIGCMEREVELLRAVRPQDVKAIQADKIALADTYRAFAMALKEPGEDLGAVSTALREELTGRGYEMPEQDPSWYAGVDEFTRLYVTCGFTQVQSELIPRPTPLPGGAADWVKSW